jgi:hypothetical protein
VAREREDGPLRFRRVLASYTAFGVLMSYISAKHTTTVNSGQAFRSEYIEVVEKYQYTSSRQATLSSAVIRIKCRTTNAVAQIHKTRLPATINVHLTGNALVAPGKIALAEIEAPSEYHCSSFGDLRGVLLPQEGQAACLRLLSAI